MSHIMLKNKIKSFVDDIYVCMVILVKYIFYHFIKYRPSSHQFNDHKKFN